MILVVQVTEVQTRSSLPHDHSLLWRDNLSVGTSSVLQALQSNQCHMLTPVDVEELVSVGAMAASVSLTEESLLKQFPSLSQQQARECVALAKVVQVHRCVHYCQEKQP